MKIFNLVLFVWEIMKCSNTFVCLVYNLTIKTRLIFICVQARASLACAARLADTSCPPEAPFGRLEVTLVNYKGDIISKYVHLSFKIDIT